MGNIVDYVKEKGDKLFSERAFSKEDALVLSQFVYLKFDNLMKEMSKEEVSLFDLQNSANFDDLFFDYRYEKDNRALFEALVSSKRFKDMKMCFYINKVEEETGTQFAAITYILDKKTVLLTFRGTDENMVGWQEDLRLALNKPVGGQKLSVKYIDDVSKYVKGPFFVSGHSKGGNLALYSSMFARISAKKRIKEIFCFDGPGFKKSFLREKTYNTIKDRVRRIIPKSSVVGMILNTDDDYMVVEAKALGLSQHNPFKWVIEKGHFKRASLTPTHKKALKSMNDWIVSLSEEELERFIDIASYILDASMADTTIEFSKSVIKHTKAAIKAAGDIDDDTKAFLSTFTKSYVDIAKDMIMEDVNEKKEAVRELLTETKEKIDTAIDKTEQRINDTIDKTGEMISETFDKTKKKIKSKSK